MNRPSLTFVMGVLLAIIMIVIILVFMMLARSPQMQTTGFSPR